VRFSQAISEGDGISLIVDVADVDAARAAASQGAEAVSVEVALGDLREVIDLPVLWRASGLPSEAAVAGADAWVISVGAAGDDGTWLVRQHDEGLALGLDCVVEVRSEEELELALEQLDPVSSRAQVDELERAGVDAVIVGARNVAGLVGDAAPPV